MSDRSGKARVLRAAAVILIMIFCGLLLCGCGKRADGGPDSTEGNKLNAELTEAQRARVIELAEAFRQFGEYDSSEGIEFKRMENIVFCMFSDKIKETEPAGFGTVSAEEADEAVIGVFGNVRIMDVMRRKYEADGDQTYYFKNGEYHVMITDNSAYTYRIESAEYNDEGNLAASVLVLREGAEQLTLTFELMPNGESFRVKSCKVHMWY